MAVSYLSLKIGTKIMLAGGNRQISRFRVINLIKLMFFWKELLGEKSAGDPGSMY